MALPRTTLEQWAVLAAVADQGGYAQAALHLHRSQTAVSYSIARLQESLDVPLLAIEGRKALLTPHGRNLLRRALSLLRDIDTLERLAGSLKQGWEPQLGLVVDAAFPRSHLLQIMAELQQLCPNTALQLSDAVLSGAEEAITETRADVVRRRGRDLTRAERVLALFGLEHALTADDAQRHVQAVVRDMPSAAGTVSATSKPITIVKKWKLPRNQNGP